jgi:geranylgeranyl pyrophosphate synthase
MSVLKSRAFFSDIIARLKKAVKETETAPQYTQTLASIVASLSKNQSDILCLPAIACEAAGGNPSKAVPIAVAWAALRVAARLLDDAEDEDVSSESYGQCTEPCVINLATGFIGIANLILVDPGDGFPPEQKLALIRNFNQMMVDMAGAQHLDLLPSGIHHLDDYWRHIQGKSGVFFGMGVQCGAMSATLEERTLERYYQFGYNLGIALQLANDFKGFFFDGPHSDLITGKRTAPFFFIEDLAPASIKEQSRMLLQHAPDHPEDRERLRQIALEQGAASYMRAEIARYRHRAVQALSPMDDPEYILIEYLDHSVPLQNNYLAHSVSNHSIHSPSDH